MATRAIAAARMASAVRVLCSEGLMG
jgi:hypothetical protein